jgi:chorismate-pyruvate lyase
MRPIFMTQSELTANFLYDPTDGVFIAQAERPAWLQDVDVAALSPLQRSLLVIDGTVTKFLEAYALEPVAIRCLEQNVETSSVENTWLATDVGQAYLHRHSVLIGEKTGRLYAYAESLIRQDRLTASMQQGLENEPGGLGRILIASEAETRREGLWFGRERIHDLPADVAVLCEGDFLSRTYRVISGQVPLMMITERFPFNAAGISPVS